jgi:glyoxalase family protein
MQPIQGLHHITAVASDPQANVDFYHHVLGQRLIKTTVNFDDPGTYHLYYGDKMGTPGTIMTFFPWGHMGRGRLGNGETAAVAYSIGPESTGFWHDRLLRLGLDLGAQGTLGPSRQRFGAEVISFSDPDGMALELIVTDEPASVRFWEGGPIPERHALRGFHGVTLWLADVEKTARLLTDQLGYAFVGQEENRYRYRGGSNDVGLYVDLLHRPGQPFGSFGAGSVHHIAFRTVDDREQLEYRQLLAAAGHGVTEVRDRQYFRSIYFRSPGGVLFEIATDAPGFLVDESVEELGQRLRLPPWLESQRPDIEAVLPRFVRKPVSKAVDQVVARV